MVILIWGILAFIATIAIIAIPLKFEAINKELEFLNKNFSELIKIERNKNNDK